jgi:hypothetical protein
MSVPTPASWLRSGYEKSLAELRDALSHRDEEGASYALFAALNWTASILDYLEDQSHPAQNDPIVLGVYFARNRVHHNWAKAISLMGPVQQIHTAATPRGGRVVRTVPAPYTTWRAWPPAAELPSGTSSRGKIEYEQELSGHPVTEALEALSLLYSAHL